MNYYCSCIPDDNQEMRFLLILNALFEYISLLILVHRIPFASQKDLEGDSYINYIGVHLLTEDEIGLLHKNKLI